MGRIFSDPIRSEEYGLLDPVSAFHGAHGLQHLCREAGQPKSSSGVAVGHQIRSRGGRAVFLLELLKGSHRLVGLWWSGIMVMYYTAIARGPLSVVIPIFNMNLIIPAVLGFLLLNEPMTVSKILGLIFASLAVVFLTR
jgi:hypothetical protein